MLVEQFIGERQDRREAQLGGTGKKIAMPGRRSDVERTAGEADQVAGVGFPYSRNNGSCRHNG
jgi:hypothetical protein